MRLVHLNVFQSSNGWPVFAVLKGNMEWSETASSINLGQVAGVAVDSKGFVHVFHRGYRK